MTTAVPSVPEADVANSHELHTKRLATSQPQFLRLHAIGRPFDCWCVLVAILGVALLGGCAINQEKEVELYRKVLDGPNPPKVSEIYEGRPLSLEEALLLANRRDENLASNGELYVQALIDKERAFANFLPTVSLAPTISYETKRTSAAAIGAVAAAGGTTDALKDVPVSGSVNVFNGFQDVSNLRRAGYTAEQREQLLLDLQMTLFLNVAQTYYLTLSNERSVTVLTNSVKVQLERVRDQQGRLQAGLARPLDVAQAEAQASATRVSLISAQNNVKNSRTMLAFLLNAPVENAILIDRLQVPDHLFSLEEALGTGQRNRLDVIAAREAVESARQSVSQAMGQYYPSVSLQVDYFLHKESFPTVSEWSGILSANVPIFTAGLVHANVRTAWSQLRQSRLAQLQVIRTVDQQVKTAYENLADSQRRLDEEHVEVKAARDALIQAEESYPVGLAAYLDIITAQDQLLTAQLSLVTEEINFKVFFIDLLRTMGKLERPETVPPPSAPPTSMPSDEEISTPEVGSGNSNGQLGARRSVIQPATQSAEIQPTTESVPTQPETEPVHSAPTTSPAVPLLPLPSTGPTTTAP